jgi:hypothetical protein
MKNIPVCRTLRWLPLLVAMLIMLYGELPQVRAEGLILTAGITSGPSPGAVSSDLTSAAGLAATFTAPSLQEEAYFVTSDASWWVDEEHIQYHAVGGTYGSPGSGQSKTATLTSSSSTTNLVFSGSPGYWRIPCILSVWYADNMNHSWSDYATVYVEFIVVDVNIAVRQYGSSDDYASSVEIAAGHIDSNAHKADVQVTVSPAVAAVVNVTMSGGAGYTCDKDAELSFDNAHIGPDSCAQVTMGSDGTLTGTLISSDFTESGVTICDARVNFAWNDYAGEDAWIPNPDSIVPGGTSVQSVILKHGSSPMNDHTLHFYVAFVWYFDAEGVLRYQQYDPAYPAAMDYWAVFSMADQTTSESGIAQATLSVAVPTNGESLMYIFMDCFDLNVWYPTD